MRPLDFIRQRPRLVFAFLLGLGCFLLLPKSLNTTHRVLIAWNVTQWFYLLRLTMLMIGATPEKIRDTAIKLDESADIVLVFFTLASLMSLGAIIFELASGKQAEGFDRLLHFGLPVLTLAGVWLMMGTLFAIHYAHEYYCAPAGEKPLRFPDEIEHPLYIDFLYFSFTIGVASQTADIAVMGSEGRRLVLLQSVLSFVFNISILGLTINIAAGLLS